MAKKRSVYGAVRLAQARGAYSVARQGVVANSLLIATGAAAAFFSPLGGGALAISGAAGVIKHRMLATQAMRATIRATAVSGIIQRSQRAKAAAASISRARQVLDRTAASRSMAASRKAVPRPTAGRRPAAERKGGDGSTEGYYRNQGGKRVFVQGYATPPGRSR